MSGCIQLAGMAPRKALPLRLSDCRSGSPASSAGSVPARPRPPSCSAMMVPLSHWRPRQAVLGLVPHGGEPAAQSVPGSPLVASSQLEQAAGRDSRAASIEAPSAARGG